MTEYGLRWVVIRSWHLQRPDHPALTLCGRRPLPQEPQAFPEPGERTCETCFRVREGRAA